MATKTTRRARFVTVLSTLLVLSLVSVAFAAWLATGDGSATATSTGAVELDIDGDADVTDLYPGAVEDLVVTIVNPNPYNVTVQTITVTEVEVDADCDLTLGSYTITGDALVVAGNNGEATVTLSDAVEMGHGATDDCQNATIALDLALTGESSPEDPANPSTIEPSPPAED